MPVLSLGWQILRRRDFITLIGGAAATWPLAARAQQSALPVVGYLKGGPRVANTAPGVTAFRQGLGSIGFIEGRNVAIDYRYDEGQYDRLPTLVADLVRQQVAVIYTGDNRTALSAKAANTTIPIVFRIGGDPIQLGLVPSLSRPGGNITGVSFLQTTTAAIRVQMLHEAAPNATIMCLLVNPANPNTEPETKETQEAASKLGIEIFVLNAGNTQEIDAAFATMAQRRVQAVVVVGDPFFSNRARQLAALTARHGLPAISSTRVLPDAGGLMSYGASSVDADRLGGIYVGRILKGEKPADLPVQQSVQTELIINLIVAKALGITVPQLLLGRADEVIE
jgi:putative ABC transport system substrate-binding protein